MLCAHHWLIAPPTGPTSPAECTRCGATRTFFNSDEANPDYRDSWNDPKRITAGYVRRMVRGGRGLRAEV